MLPYVFQVTAVMPIVEKLGPEWASIQRRVHQKHGIEIAKDFEVKATANIFKLRAISFINSVHP